MENSKHYVMNEEITEDLVSCLKGNPKALDIMTDFTCAFVYMYENVDDICTATLVDFQNDSIQRVARREDYEEMD